MNHISNGQLNEVKVSELDILDNSPPCSTFSISILVSHVSAIIHTQITFNKKKQYSDIVM